MFLAGKRSTEKEPSAMHIDIAPETARLVREEINSGHFRTVDDLIKAGVEALREKNSFADARPHTKADNLSDLLLNSPFAGAALDLGRSLDLPRHIDIISSPEGK
jgi:Arc/MetJ-type ribon-helix-helix transcriptional regulator